MVFESISVSGTQPYVIAYILTAIVSGLAFLWLGKKYEKNVPWKFPIIHFFIVMWSALMYLNFIYETPLSNYAWYMDWIISTPLIVAALTLSALYNSKKPKYYLLAAVMGLQAMLILAGALAQATPTALGTQVFFWFSVMLMFGVFYLIFKPIRAEAKKTSPMLGKKFDYLGIYVIVFWLTYPTVWYFSDVVGIAGGLGAFETSLLFVVLPFMCKQAFGFLDLYLLNKAGEEMNAKK